MTTTRKVAKCTAWILGGVLVIAIALYLIALAVNWHDRPPSAAALELRRVLDERPVVAIIDNAYVYMLGFSAPAEIGPQEAGERRLEWMKANGHARDSKVPDPISSVDLQAERSAGLSNATNVCRSASRKCEESLEKNSAAIAEWLKSNALFLDRYRELIQRDTWREFVPAEGEIPIPLYSGTTHAHRLYLMSMWELSGRGDVATVRAGLDADLAFWRRVLASSDMMITKVIAVSAIRQHFVYGYLTLKKLPAEQLQNALPPSWQLEISNEERSLLRSMAGELAFAAAMLRQVGSEAATFVYAEEQNFLTEFGTRLLLPLFQPEDSINQLADRYLAFARAFDVPLSAYPTVMREMTLNGNEVAMLGFIYNPFGDWLSNVDGLGMARYPSRVGDLEGARRAALLALHLRSQSVAAEQVAEELQEAASRNPYNAEPFVWDESESAVVFVGLEESERGRHAYVY